MVCIKHMNFLLISTFFRYFVEKEPPSSLLCSIILTDIKAVAAKYRWSLTVDPSQYFKS